MCLCVCFIAVSACCIMCFSVIGGCLLLISCYLLMVFCIHRCARFISVVFFTTLFLFVFGVCVGCRPLCAVCSSVLFIVIGFCG